MKKFFGLTLNYLYPDNCRGCSFNIFDPYPKFLMERDCRHNCSVINLTQNQWEKSYYVDVTTFNHKKFQRV